MLNNLRLRVNLFVFISLFAFLELAHLTSIRRNRCELKLVADHVFYEVIGNKNYANAARYLINLIERVNGIFSQVDWGLDINGDHLMNLGFTIKEIKILDKPTYKSPDHFNSNVRNDVNAVELLKSFSSEEGSNKACLSVLVTAKSLQYSVLGMSNIGSPGLRGICATNQQNGTFMNTALITVSRKSELMITRVVDLVLAHELGHSWGSLHDEISDEECVPQNSREGRYVMWESANTGYDSNNYNFSPCSIHSIHRVLYAIAHQCFVEEKRALCGNGILEEGEECDSGAQLNRDKKDNCCTADCRLKIGALCSPRHSECCSSNCTFLGAKTLCQKRDNDTCKKESFCSGTNDKCLEPKPLEDGNDCTDEGKCVNGECVSLCRTISPFLVPCLCEDAGVACRRCCRSVETGICRPVNPEKWLPENSMCIYGKCSQNICEKEATDSAHFFWKFFDKGPSHRKFLADYLVFIVVIISLLIWCPCGAMIIYNDKQKHQKLVDKRMAAQKNVQVSRERKRVTPTRSINEKLFTGQQIRSFMRNGMERDERMEMVVYGNGKITLDGDEGGRRRNGATFQSEIETSM